MPRDPGPFEREKSCRSPNGHLQMMSGTASTGQNGISQSRDGIPGWNGDPSLFTEFEEECLIWVQSVPWHKRQLCGPKLIQELTGPERETGVGTGSRLDGPSSGRGGPHETPKVMLGKAFTARAVGLLAAILSQHEAAVTREHGRLHHQEV